MQFSHHIPVNIYTLHTRCILRRAESFSINIYKEDFFAHSRFQQGEKTQRGIEREREKNILYALSTRANFLFN